MRKCFALLCGPLLVGILSACGGGGGSPEPASPPPFVASVPTVTETVAELNRLRAPARGPVTMDAQVMSASQDHANYLAASYPTGVMQTVSLYMYEDPTKAAFVLLTTMWFAKQIRLQISSL